MRSISRQHNKQEIFRKGASAFLIYSFSCYSSFPSGAVCCRHFKPRHLELRFYDAEGRLLAAVEATTQHDPQLPFDSRGAIFRGLDTGTARIAQVHVRPRKPRPPPAITIAMLDYVCFNDTPRDPGPEHQIQTWVNGLGAAVHKTREESSRQLKELPPSWLPVLQAVKSPDPEVSVRLREVQEALAAKQTNPTPNGHNA